MESNGFGSFINKIVVRVDKDYAETAQKSLSAKVIDTTDQYVDLVWKRASTKTGDDETVVWELAMFIGIPEGKWKIIWKDSHY